MKDKTTYEPLNCGIYCLVNKTNGKRYIGQSINLKNRKLRFFQFKYSYAGECINNARNKYNSSDFWEYSVLEYCTPDELNQKEKSYIQLYNSMNPEFGYNSTTGGDNLSGISVSSETKIRMSESKKGNKNSFFNKHHTEETKNIISKNNSVEVEQYDLEGNFIKCWESGTKASQELKVSLSQIFRCCKIKGIKAGDYQWRYKNSNVKVTSIVPNYNQPIYQINYNTGEIIKEWKSSVEAAKCLNIRCSLINRCCEKKVKSAYKCYWCYKADYKNFIFEKYKIENESARIKATETARIKNMKAIYQVNPKTEEIIKEWESASTAGKELNITSTLITGCCSGKHRMAGGYMWMYKYNPVPYKINKKEIKREVIQIDKDTDETINVFESISEAGRYLKVNSTSISRCCNGIQKLAHGFKWQYLNEPIEYKPSGKRPVKIPVLQIDKDTDEVIREWESETEAGKALGIDSGSISRVCNNKPKYKTAGGFKWRYKSDFDNNTDK